MLQATRCAANISRHGRIRYCSLFTKRRFKSSSRELGCSIGTRFGAFWTTFPNSGRLCCVFGLYAKPRSGKGSPAYHGGYSGYECSSSRNSGYIEIYIYIYVYIALHTHNTFFIRTKHMLWALRRKPISKLPVGGPHVGDEYKTPAVLHILQSHTVKRL